MGVSNLKLTAGQGRSVIIPPNDRRSRFAAQTVSAGTARYQIVVEADNFSDAQAGSFRLDASDHKALQRGVLDDGVAMQGFQMPSNVSKASEARYHDVIDSRPSTYRCLHLSCEVSLRLQRTNRVAHIRDCRFERCTECVQNRRSSISSGTLQIGWRAPEAIIQTTGA